MLRDGNYLRALSFVGPRSTLYPANQSALSVSSRRPRRIIFITVCSILPVCGEEEVELNFKLGFRFLIPGAKNELPISLFGFSPKKIVRWLTLDIGRNSRCKIDLVVDLMYSPQLCINQNATTQARYPIMRRKTDNSPCVHIPLNFSFVQVSAYSCLPITLVFFGLPCIRIVQRVLVSIHIHIYIIAMR